MAESGETPDWREQARLAGWQPTEERDAVEDDGPGDAGPPRNGQPPHWMADAQSAGWSPHAASFAPQPASPPASAAKGLPRWAVVTLAAGAVLLIVLGGLAALLLVSGSDNTDPQVDRSPLKLTTAAKATSTTITRAAGAPSTNGGGLARKPPPAGLVTYDGGGFTAKRPAGWKAEADGVQHDGYIESKWRNPADANTSVTIDRTPGTTGSAYSNAQGVRAQANVSREFLFKQTNLAGAPATQWVFETGGDRRVDYFVNACGTGYAILGSTSPGSFQQYNALFRLVARSVAQNASGC